MNKVSGWLRLRAINILAGTLLILLFYGCKESSMNSSDTTGFSDALASVGPATELGGHADMYHWLIGGWDVRVMDHLPDGTTMETQGEWYFSWVLEGRAVQDVWIAPVREQRNLDTPRIGNRYGSTLRIFDVSEKVWTIYWFNPVSGAKTTMQAEKKGNDIVQTGKNGDGEFMRWVFTDIAAKSFRWYGERSTDGQTWNLEAEFFATQMKK